MASRKYWLNMVLALVLLFSVPVLRAQENATPANGANAAQAAKPESLKAKDEQKAADEENAIRHSSAVKYIARKTGLTDDQAYWVCIGINFAIVFGSIAVMLRKKLPGYFTGRTSAIQKGIEEARQASEEARQRLSDLEIAGMKREADENGKAEEQRIQAAGEEERRRIVASAEQEIEMTANAARRELKSYVSELAIELAEKKIRVSKDTDEALVRAFTTQMGKDGN
jgi:F-type H+-transporting ATPase subunit b